MPDTHRLQHSGAALAGLVALVGMALLPVSASAAPTDATLTVIVNRDVDHNGGYSSDVDQPQPGIKIAVTDARGNAYRVSPAATGDSSFGQIPG